VIDRNKEIAIIGGGPAGALAGYLLAKKGFINVTIYDPGQFEAKPEEKIEQCPGCAGIIQPKVLQMLKDLGFDLSDVIQNELSAESTIYAPGIDLPVINKSGGVTTVYRRAAPVRQPGGQPRTKSFDAKLLNEAIGAKVSYKKIGIKEINLRREENENGKVTLIVEGGDPEKPIEVDFVIGAYGHNALKENGINIKYPEGITPLDKPTASISATREIFLGREKVDKLLKNKMHFFGNPTGEIWFAMVVPKGDFVTVSIMGRGRDNESVMNVIMNSFLKSDSIKNLLGDISKQVYCSCTSTYTTKSPENYTVQDKNGDLLMVNIGDAGPTRPMKNGMGAAMDSAKKLVEILSQYGFGREALEIYKKYIDQEYVLDNYWAEFILEMTDKILARPALLKPTKFILTHNIWPFKNPINNIISLIISGEKPYRQVPLAKIAEKLFHK
jgi:flavin-dependent dehydrogenase